MNQRSARASGRVIYGMHITRRLATVCQRWRQSLVRGARPSSALPELISSSFTLVTLRFAMTI